MYVSISDVFERVKRELSQCDYKNLLLNSIPIISVCKHYDFKQNALRDIMAGIGVGMATIPQALGYATLLKVPAAYGLFSAVFCSAVYSIFTSSASISFTISISGVFFGLDALNALG